MFAEALEQVSRNSGKAIRPALRASRTQLRASKSACVRRSSSNPYFCSWSAATFRRHLTGGKSILAGRHRLHAFATSQSTWNVLCLDFAAHEQADERADDFRIPSMMIADALG